jgi:hypothetical protein
MFTCLNCEEVIQYPQSQRIKNKKHKCKRSNKKYIAERLKIIAFNAD